MAASEGQAVGRHERRPHVASRSGRAARAGMTLVGPAPGTEADRTMQDTQTHPIRRAQATPTRRSRAAQANGTQATRAARADGDRAANSGATHPTLAATAGVSRVGPGRASRSRQAARGGLASWTGRARRVAEQARVWWAEGAERVSARARERWNEQVGAQRAARQRPAASGHTAGEAFRTTGDGGSAERFRGAGRDDTARFGSANGTRAGRPTTPRHLVAEGRRASRREDLVTGWCSLLLVLGLYLDGWSHGERAGGGLTLWHGVLYLGFAGTAAWILTRNQRRGAWSLRAVPAGYRLALVGVGLAMVAVAGDTVWHTLFGASRGLGQLISPFHLVLFAGACLLVSSALRAAWSGPSPARVPGLRAFWPVVLSTTLVVAMTAFFFQHVSPLAAAGPSAGAPSGEPAQVYELTGLLAHNFLFLAPVLLLLLRWQTPLGTFTVMAGSVALLLATQTGLGLVGLAGAAVLGGAAADAAVTLLRPSPQRRWAARAVAVVAPAVYWTSHFALLGAGYGVRWELEFWLGSVVWACLSGLTLALLMWPPAVPLTAWNRGRAATRRPATPTAMPARMVGR
ncbi:MAG TPA: hypothetical protein VFA73_14270 [Actinomycetota bacterium]|nr:hypothetical protein [Actinomycetota bacterium]